MIFVFLQTLVDFSLNLRDIYLLFLISLKKIIRGAINQLRLKKTNKQKKLGLGKAMAPLTYRLQHKSVLVYKRVVFKSFGGICPTMYFSLDPSKFSFNTSGWVLRFHGNNLLPETLEALACIRDWLLGEMKVNGSIASRSKNLLMYSSICLSLALTFLSDISLGSSPATLSRFRTFDKDGSDDVRVVRHGYKWFQ